MNCILLALSLLSTPFVDTQSRFSVELPAGWRFMPQPGDLTGASFQVRRQGVPANCAIKEFKVRPGTTLSDYTGSARDAVRRQPGYRLLEEGSVALAGVPAFRRRFVMQIGSDAQSSKMVDQTIAVRGRKVLVFHVESLAEAFAGYEREFSDMAKSIVWLSLTKKNEVVNPVPAKIVGRWQMKGDSKIVLNLRADALFSLGASKGRFRVEKDRLFLSPLPGTPEVFSWSVKHGILELFNANLDRPVQYQKLSSKKPQRRKTKKTSKD